ncbi:MAG TPA: hypothetical protein VKA18_05910 [Alphaproteobacteria bacterium]|nr:hypothetical protein [Alphaproteobacteria bacterium]
MLYWPAATARFGMHIEDTYFLSALWRMACGQEPYADFEFLYGPLMVGLADRWMSADGFSATAYYTYYMAVQVAFYVTLIWILQRYIQSKWWRYLSFAIVFIFTFDILFGLNWIAARYFGVVLAILLVAASPNSIARALGVGSVIGLQAAMSYEYGIAALVAALAMYGVLLFYRDRGRAVVCAATALTAATAVWALVSFALLGPGFGAYLEATLHISTVSSALGLGQFAFYWSVHTLALFLFLSCIIALFSGSLRQLGRRPVTEGDLQLIGGCVFLVIGLRISLQRADFLHFAVAFVPLILMWLLGQPRSLLAFWPRLRGVAMGAILIATIAHAAGYTHYGAGILFAQARGISHEIKGLATVGEMASRVPSIHEERSKADPRIAGLAARLAAPDLVDRPVLFYQSSWDMAVSTGVCPKGYAFYDILYGDALYPHFRTAQENPDLIVVMEEKDYERLLAGPPVQAESPALQGRVRVLNWLNSSHYRQGWYENEVESRMWQEALGNELMQAFRVRERLDRVLLLERIVE